MRNLEFVYLNATALRPHACNAWTQKQICRVAASIRQFGWSKRAPIDGRGSEIGGHGRLGVRKPLGLENVPPPIRAM